MLHDNYKEGNKVVRVAGPLRHRGENCLQVERCALERSNGTVNGTVQRRAGPSYSCLRVPWCMYETHVRVGIDSLFST